jgi:hypothetical protein
VFDPVDYPLPLGAQEFVWDLVQKSHVTLLAREFLDARQLSFELLEPVIDPDEPVRFLPADIELLVHELHEGGVASQEQLVLVDVLELFANFSKGFQAPAHGDLDPCYCTIKMSRELLRA